MENNKINNKNKELTNQIKEIKEANDELKSKNENLKSKIKRNTRIQTIQKKRTRKSRNRFNK